MWPRDASGKVGRPWAGNTLEVEVVKAEGATIGIDVPDGDAPGVFRECVFIRHPMVFSMDGIAISEVGRCGTCIGGVTYLELFGVRGPSAVVHVLERHIKPLFRTAEHGRREIGVSLDTMETEYLRAFGGVIGIGDTRARTRGNDFPAIQFAGILEAVGVRQGFGGLLLCPCRRRREQGEKHGEEERFQ